MPTADRLGDKWEGTIPQGHSEWWDAQIAATTAVQRGTLQYNQDFIGKMAQAFRTHYYVSCWHRNKHENYAMWSCYTSGPESVAINTRYELLVNSLPSYVLVGNVRYVDYSAIRQPSMNMFEVIMHKDTYFSFEQETRAVVLPPASDPTEIAHFRDNHFTLENDPSFRCVAPPVSLSDLITSVVLHPEATEEFSERVRTLCQTTGMPNPISSRRARPLGT